MDKLQQYRRWIERLEFDGKQFVFSIGNTRIPKAPKLRQVYVCEFSPPVLPELGKRRPVIVLSRQNTLHGPVTVAPITRNEQSKNEQKYWVKIPAPYEENEDAWVLCKHITAVSTRRLRVHREGIPLIEDNQFQEIVRKVLNNLPDRR